MEIRPYGPADQPACQRLLGAAAFDPPPVFFVMEHEGAIIGCGGYEITPSGAWLRHGQIHPQFRGNGLGRFLLFYQLKAISNEPGVEFVRVSPGQADEFFLSQGFKPAPAGELVKRLAVCP